MRARRGSEGGTDGVLPMTKFSGGTFDRVSDPSVAYDAGHGVWLIAALAVDDAPTVAPEEPAVIVSRSTDGGLTWSSPVTVSQVPPHVAHFGFPDKPWAVCDSTPTSPFYGHCYVEWDEWPAEHVEIDTSSDGG